MYKLHTTDHPRGIYVRNQPTKEQMFRYIRAKKLQGIPLRDIIFCWGPVLIWHSAESIVVHEERKNANKRTNENTGATKSSANATA